MLDNGNRWSWYAAERAGVVRAAYGLTPPLPGEAAAQDEEREAAVAEIVRARAESSGPFTAAGLAELLALDERAVTQAIARLETQGLVLRGRFRLSAPDGPEEFCDRRILARIHRSTIGRLRREIEPVPVASLIRFLLEWQHVAPGSRVTGDAGLVGVVEQLQGFEARGGGLGDGAPAVSGR